MYEDPVFIVYYVILSVWKKIKKPNQNQETNLEKL